MKKLFLLILVLFHIQCTSFNRVIDTGGTSEEVEPPEETEMAEDIEETDENEEPEKVDPPEDRTIVEVKAFPSAYGGGANTKGGRGGKLYIVNTLKFGAPSKFYPASGKRDAYYTGGYKKALETKDVGYIVFNVSGNIEFPVGGYIFKNVANKTVFGQSAPKGGITLWGGSNRFQSYNNGIHDLIFRFIRSRPLRERKGTINPKIDDAYTWAFLFRGGERIILDHISASFANDKLIGGSTRQQHANFNGKFPECPCWLRDVTFQHGLYADGGTSMYVSVNGGRDGDPEQFVNNISWLNNVTSSSNRNANMAFDGYGEFMNNIIYNTPQKNSRNYHNLKFNHINNYYKRSNDSYNWIDNGSEGKKLPSIYSKGNVYSGKVGGSAVSLTGNSKEDNSILWVLRDRKTRAPAKYFSKRKHIQRFKFPWKETSAKQAYKRLVNDQNVGAFKYLDNNGLVRTYRDAFDTQMLNVIQSNLPYRGRLASNWKLPNIPKTTRSSNYDTDNDGMADAWEIRKFGNLKQSYRGDFDGNGYENIEEYMNQVDFR